MQLLVERRRSLICLGYDALLVGCEVLCSGDERGSPVCDPTFVI